MKKNEYKCDMCGEINEKCRTEEEVQKECEDNFGTEIANRTDNAIICQDCYDLILPQIVFDKLNGTLISKCKE